MVSTIRLYVDASYAVAIMALVGIISGSLTAATTGNTPLSLLVAVAMFALTGAFLTIRLWWVTRRRPAAEALLPESDDRRGPA